MGNGKEKQPIIINQRTKTKVDITLEKTHGSFLESDLIKLAGSEKVRKVHLV